MLQELQLNGLPETTDSLAWSEAGDLCVITGVRVQLFLPKRKPSTQAVKQPGLKPWSHIVLHVNNFGIKEWPEFKQRPYADLSVGEELSDSHVVSCSWSNIGLAPHGRCALGILTANGLYCIWHAEKDPALQSSWSRQFVLNHVLIEHFGSADRGHRNGVVVDGHAARRIRVRAAVWAKKTILPQSRSHTGAHLLALLNDQGEILVLQMRMIKSEDGQDHYTSTILHVVDIERRLQRYPDGLLDELQWSEWSTHDSESVSTLVCFTEGMLWSIGIKATGSLDDEIDVRCAMLGSSPRKTPAWNMPKSQMFMLDSLHLTSQQRQFQKRWETGKAEGYPAMTRYHGMATYNDFQAIHISLHPRTVPEYHIAAQETSLILFSHKTLAQSPAEAASTNFDFENMMETDTSSDGIEAVWNHLLNNADHLDKESDQVNGNYSLWSKILHLYLAQAFLNGWQMPLTTTLVENLAKRSFDQAILDDIEEKREEASSQEALKHIESALKTMLGELLAFELCSMCDSRLEWNGETTARCQQGHQYDRCSLTLLAIQEPGVTKACSTCNREYLDDKQLLRNEADLSPSTQQFLVDLFKTFSRLYAYLVTFQALPMALRQTKTRTGETFAFC